MAVVRRCSRGQARQSGSLHHRRCRGRDRSAGGRTSPWVQIDWPLPPSRWASMFPLRPAFSPGNAPCDGCTQAVGGAHRVQLLGAPLKPDPTRGSGPGLRVGAQLAPPLAEALAARGTRGMVFRGRDGRDKITTSAATDLWEVRDGAVTHYEIAPEDFGVSRCAVTDLQGNSPAQRCCGAAPVGRRARADPRCGPHQRCGRD